MIEKEKVTTVVRSQLPKLEELVIEEIVQEIIREGEAILNKMIREVIARKREEVFKRNSKESPIEW